MKQNDNSSNSITEPILRDLFTRNQASGMIPVVSPVSTSLPEPAELDQDCGGAYNPNGDFPQQ